jgi:tetratricopeptide (TPR) repeat protein
LSKLENLRVIPPSSSFHFKGSGKTPVEAGGELKVRAVVTGRVQQRGETLVISARMIDVSRNAQLWGEQYSRPMTDILAIQESIARDISRQLKLQLTPEEESALTNRGTDDTEAYQLYLRGRFHWNKFTGKGLKKSIEYFRQAIEQDPGYAEAYAGLAYAYHLLGAGYGYRDLSPKEAYAKARAAVQKALEIDEALAQAHSALGAIHFNYDWDWAGAGREFQRALELSPDYATAHVENSWYLIVLGRFDEALIEMERALELDPLSVVINSDLAAPYYFAGEYDKAIELSRKSLEMNPNFAMARLRLGWAYLEKGMHREAIVEIEKAVAVLRDNTEAIGFLGYAYARSGETDKALRVLDNLQDLSEKGFVSSFGRALIYVGLGEKDEAFVWLEKAYEERETNTPYLKVSPWFDPIRDDPRFQSLLRRMNFPP